MVAILTVIPTGIMVGTTVGTTVGIIMVAMEIVIVIFTVLQHLILIMLIITTQGFIPQLLLIMEVAMVTTMAHVILEIVTTLQVVHEQQEAIA